MRVTGTLHRDHLIASIIVVLVHLLLAWALTRLLHARIVPDARDGDGAHAIRIEFIHRPARAGSPGPSVAAAAGAPLGPVPERTPARPRPAPIAPIADA